MSCILSTVEEHDSQADSAPLPPPIPDPRFAFFLLCAVIAIERFASSCVRVDRERQRGPPRVAQHLALASPSK